jgi:hypothetical protein
VYIAYRRHVNVEYNAVNFKVDMATDKTYINVSVKWILQCVYKKAVKYLYPEVGGTSEKLQDIRMLEISRLLVNFISLGFMNTCISMHSICMLKSNFSYDLLHIS